MIEFTRFLFRTSRIAYNVHLYQSIFHVLCWISKRCRWKGKDYVHCFKQVDERDNWILTTLKDLHQRIVTKTVCETVLWWEITVLSGYFLSNRRYALFQSIYSGLRLTEGLISWKRSFQEKGHYFSNRWWTKRRSRWYHADDKNEERRAEQCSRHNDLWHAYRLTNPQRYCSTRWE